MSDTALAFEVQIYMQGKWRTDSVFDDRALAEDEALRALESNRRPQAVRIVRESVDPATNLITSTTVFRRSRLEDQNREARSQRLVEMKAEQAAKDRRRPEAGTGQTRRTVRKPQPKQSTHWLWLVMLGFGLIIALFLTLIGMHSWFYAK